MTRRAVPHHIPARTTLECPTCRRRVETALAATSVTCHRKHDGVAMVVVVDNQEREAG